MRQCGRCGQETALNCFVSPIDENGKNLDRVYLCKKCHEEWGKAYRSGKVNAKLNAELGTFEYIWATLWKHFMEKYDKEKVEFT